MTKKRIKNLIQSLCGYAEVNAEEISTTGSKDDRKHAREVLQAAGLLRKHLPAIVDHIDSTQVKFIKLEKGKKYRIKLIPIIDQDVFSKNMVVVRIGPKAGRS